ncbi:hypothetical protein HNP86_001547 [Methanococcus maripaludis]|uniref:Dolichyl-phosphate-mannose-protein mannosyltransferase n=1 Tax=Methanococcus maripaludis TaxID=39152 RepID=A0A7J9NVQ8_METMI|nr:hypothetical protein [Methanococcus maripaludis]
MYQHAGIIQKNIFLGEVPEIEPILSNQYSGLSGFYISGIIISLISNISPNKIFILPIYLVPISLIFYIIMLNLNKNKVLAASVVFILTTFTTNISYLNFHPHGLGLLLFLLMFLFMLKLYNNINSAPIVITIFLIIMSINIVSYKSTFWAITFLFCLLPLLVFNQYFLNSNKNLKKTLLHILITSLVFTLAFNKFFYNTFISVLSIDFTNGTERLLLTLFKTGEFDILSHCNLYYTSPDVLLNIIYLRQGIIFVFVAFFIYCLIKNHVIKRTPLSSNYLMMLSLLLMGISNLIIYNSLGLFDIKVITLLSLFVFPILYNSSTKKLITLSVLLVCVLNFGYLLLSNEYNEIQKDDNYFSYIYPSVNWYISKDSQALITKTDVLTKGYWINIMAEQNYVKYPTHFNVDDVVLITNCNENIKPPKKSIFVLNSKLPHFSITNWRIIKSWKNYQNIITTNPNISRVYSSSEYISIYYVNA